MSKFAKYSPLEDWVEQSSDRALSNLRFVVNIQ